MLGSLNISPKDFNLTINEEEDLLKSVVNFLGHRRRNKYVFPFLISVYSFIFATGLTGNICTCLTIWKSRDMHTPTNFYLFSLAISDLLLISLGLSVEMSNIYESWPWKFGESFCVFRTVVLEIVTSASILTVLCFTIERYLAICFPMISQKVLGGLNRAIKMIMIVWFLSFLLAVPYTFTSGSFISVKSEIRNISIEILDSRICAIRPEYWESMLYYMAVTTFLVFVIPIIVITVLYVLMGITLYKTSHSTLNNNNHQKNRGKKSQQIIVDHRGQQHIFLREDSTLMNKSKPNRNPRRAVLKMLVAVVIAFFICWAPFHTQRITAFLTRLLDKTNQNITSDAATKFQEILFFTSGVLYYLSATVNPLLYNLMSKRYRNSFKRTLCRWKKLSFRNCENPKNYSNPNNQYYIRREYQQKQTKNLLYNQCRENLFQISMSKYKLVVGSRRISRRNSDGNSHHQTSFHYRLSFIQNKQRQHQNQLMKLHLQQTKFSFNFIQQSNKHRHKTILNNKYPPLTPPNSSINHSKNSTTLNTKHL